MALPTALLISSLTLARPPAVHELQVVFNETDSAKKVAPKVLELLAEKGYDLSPKAVFGELKSKKTARVALKLEVLKPSTCFVAASAVDLPAAKEIWAWQTRNDKAPCAEQVRDAVESFALKRPPEKKAP